MNIMTDSSRDVVASISNVEQLITTLSTGVSLQPNDRSILIQIEDRIQSLRNQTNGLINGIYLSSEDRNSLSRVNNQLQTLRQQIVTLQGNIASSTTGTNLPHGQGSRLESYAASSVVEVEMVHGRRRA